MLYAVVIAMLSAWEANCLSDALANGIQMKANGKPAKELAQEFQLGSVVQRLQQLPRAAV